MASRGVLKEFKERQQQLEKQASSSILNSLVSKRKIKRKNLLHGCKLCPERTFPVSAQSKTRPRNQSVEGHALKEHPDMDFTTLTRKWGYRVYYEDQTFENIPLIEHGDVEEEERRTKARRSQLQGHDLDHNSKLSQDEKNLHMLLSAVQPATGNEHEGWSMRLDSPQQAILPTSINEMSDSMDQQHGIGLKHQHLAQMGDDHKNNLCQQTDAPSYYPELPVLSIQLADSDTINGTTSPDFSQQEFINDLNKVINGGAISPFDPDEPFRSSTYTPLDPQLALQQELSHDLSPPSYERNQAQSTIQMAENNQALPYHCTQLPYCTQAQHTCEGAHLAKQYQDQVDGHGLFSETSSSGFDESDSTHTSFMQQMQSQHNSYDASVSREDYHARSNTFNPSQANGVQRQLHNSSDAQGFLHNNTEAPNSSAGSLQDGLDTSAAHFDIQRQPQFVVPEAPTQPPVPTHQSPSPFKVPATPASATHPALKRSRSSRSVAKQSGPTEKPKTPTPSPQKRKATASPPQTPTPKSRRTRYASATPTTSEPSPNVQPQSSMSSTPTPTSQYTPFTLPGPTPTPLQYCSAGPLVFPQVTFAELHTLDREALTGNHGPLVANLARLAFFGSDANRDVPRTREKQMMDMIGYLRLQREWFYVTGSGGQGGGNTS